MVKKYARMATTSESWWIYSSLRDLEVFVNTSAGALHPGLVSLLSFFTGVLIGIAIRTGSPLSLSLAEPVWKQLADMPLTVADLTEVDKDYVPGNKTPHPYWAYQGQYFWGAGMIFTSISQDSGILKLSFYSGFSGITRVVFMREGGSSYSVMWKYNIPLLQWSKENFGLGTRMIIVEDYEECHYGLKHARKCVVTDVS